MMEAVLLDAGRDGNSWQIYGPYYILFLGWIKFQFFVLSGVPLRKPRPLLANNLLFEQERFFRGNPLPHEKLWCI
jgi:hypothetical protein